MKGMSLGFRTELNEVTGAVDENNLPILVLKDRGTKTLSATFVPIEGN